MSPVQIHCLLLLANDVMALNTTDSFHLVAPIDPVEAQATSGGWSSGWHYLAILEKNRITECSFLPQMKMYKVSCLHDTGTLEKYLSREVLHDDIT